jgi:DNA-directed RNA polymerase subunit RPC12/RpoP
VRTDEQNGCTHEVYTADDAETARSFLLSKDVTQDLYYVIVETRDGVWGRDVKGLYLDGLRPWQTDLDSADCAAGEMLKTANGTIWGVEAAPQGYSDNFILTVQCGSCGREWLDGVRYQEHTVVRCPDCMKRNLFDSRRIRVIT